MEQKKFIQVLRKIVKEEVRSVIKEDLTEILQEGLQRTINEIKTPVTTKKHNKFKTNIGEKIHYSKKVVSITKKELDDHREFLNKSLKKNYY